MVLVMKKRGYGYLRTLMAIALEEGVMIGLERN